MEQLAEPGSPVHLILLALLLFSRGMDLLSTWVATPNLALEGNPIAKKLGWKWGSILNLLLCLIFSLWPFSAVIISTTSLLVAARNFQSAWLMRTIGEDGYRAWYSSHFQQSSKPLYLFCLLGQTILVALVGAGLLIFASEFIALGIGLGIVTYAFTVLFYSLLAAWRLR